MQLHSAKVRIKNKAFQDRIKGIQKDILLGVSIDWSKSFHKVMLFDFNGKIIKKPFEINPLLSGYKKLTAVIENVQKKKNCKKVFIAIEQSGSWAHSLLANLGEDFEDVWLVNCIATAANREQKLMKGLKTDDIDLCSIADLLIRGECYKYVPDESPYLDLRLRTYWRENKVHIQTKLKHQIINRLAKCYPSVIKTTPSTRLPFSTIFKAKIFNYLLNLNMVPSEILSLKDEDMRAIFSKEKKVTQTRYSITIKKAFSEYLA
ncbi:MAG: transposase, partial [Sphingobacteriales bacterium]